MGDLSKYRLAYELFGSVIAFDKDNNVAFAGGVVLKTFTFLGIDIEGIISNGYNSEDGQNLLLAFHKARTTHRVVPFKFKKCAQEFLIMPANGSNHQDVFLSLKSTINHVSSIEHDLKERVKELECLYNISHELQVSTTLLEAFEKSTEHIRKAFQYPEYATVVIEYANKKFISKGGREDHISNYLSDLNIMRNDKKRGEIKVIYHRKIPFLKEEINLLKEVSQKFTKAIEKEERRKTLEKQRTILLNKNNKLLELTSECREAREKLQAFFMAFTEKTFVIDNQYNIVFSNSDEIGNSGKCFRIVFGENDICSDCPANHTFKFAETSSADREFAGEYYKLLTYPMFNDNGVVDKAIEVCRNVTKEKKMEDELFESQKLVSLGKLIAGVAHEINNPNTFILGNTKIIKEAFSDLIPIAEEKYENVPGLKIARLPYSLFKDNVSVLIDDIYNGAVKIKRIVDELRNYAKKDDDVLADIVDINYLIENAIRLIKKQLKDNITVKLELSDDIPKFAGNTGRLDQVFINLVLNAAHAIGIETGEIRIRTSFDPVHNKVILSVKDNGKGMDETTKQNIFDPFFTTKRNEGGIGLGLAISHRIVKEHKGDIDVQSKVGKGTTFIIILPAVEPDNKLKD